MRREEETEGEGGLERGEKRCQQREGEDISYSKLITPKELGHMRKEGVELIRK